VRPQHGIGDLAPAERGRQRAARHRPLHRAVRPVRARVADTPAAGDRRARSRRLHQQADRRTALPLPPDRRNPPVPGLPEARHCFPRRPSRRPDRRPPPSSPRPMTRAPHHPAGTRDPIPVI
jgi:hypothetical protein